MTFDPRWRTGHILGPFDAEEPAYRDHPDVVGARSVSEGDTDLRPDLPPIRLQIAEDCCAHAVSTLAWWMMRLLGISPPFDDIPSVLHLYATAQLWARPLQRLRDEGSSLRSMFEGMIEEGLVSEKDWPETSENVNAIPPDDLWRKGEACTITGARRLSDGAASSDEMKLALSMRRPTTICLRVDERFANIGPNVYDAPGGRIIGSHCMLAVGYVSFLDAFIVRNSWGEEFGDLGHALVSSDVVNRLSYEKYVLDVIKVAVR